MMTLAHVARWFVAITAVVILTMQSTPGSEIRPLLHESFDSPDRGTVIQLKSGASLTRNVQGSALHLPNQAYAVLPVVSPISAQSGTIAFWLQPGWDENDSQSHVLLTARWDDGKAGYLAVSFGWWEPLGEKRLYFVVNNQQSMHCSTPYRFERDRWTFMVVSWSSGTRGDCAIYVDGDKVAGHSAPFIGTHKSTGPWFIGSDQGATDQRQRSAEFVIDELRIFDRKLSDRDVQALYTARDVQPFTTGRAEWDWMRKTLALPVITRRTPDGLLKESRVIFDEDIHWAYSKESAERILQQVKAAGFNVYVPCVWHGGGAYFPNSIAEVDARLTVAIGNGYDPLGYLIERAHELGIEVHPWFMVALREGDRYPQFNLEDAPEKAYDLHNPLFRDFIVRLILDVVARYDVDGLNLDYIRTVGICLSQACKDSYQKRFGTPLIGDYYLRFVSGTARDRIQAWQDDAVANIVARVSTGAKKLKPRTVVSVDGHPVPRTEVRALQGRNEVAWANNGWVDVIYSMDYRKRIDDARADAVRTELTNPQKLYLLFGNYERIDEQVVPRSGALVNRYAQFAQRKWPGSGVAFYIYNLLSPDQSRALRTGAFSEAARPDWPLTAPGVDKWAPP